MIKHKLPKKLLALREELINQQWAKDESFANLPSTSNLQTTNIVGSNQSELFQLQKEEKSQSLEKSSDAPVIDPSPLPSLEHELDILSYNDIYPDWINRILDEHGLDLDYSDDDGITIIHPRRAFIISFEYFPFNALSHSFIR